MLRRTGDLRDSPFGRLQVPDCAPGGADVWLTIRPERLTIGSAAAGHDHPARGRLVSSAFLGTRTRAIVEAAGMRRTVDVADDERTFHFTSGLAVRVQR